MNEYISKDKIIQDIEEEIGISNMALDEDVWFDRGLKTALSYIKKLPAADVQPVKHGKWLRMGRTRECTICGEPCICNGDWSVLSAYCPTCGAKMDLE